LLLKPNYIIGFGLSLCNWLCVSNFVAEPKQLEAADEMFVAQKFQQLDGVASDSLYKLSLNGSEGKFGFIKIADEYSGTDAGNLANYYAGMAYLNTGKYNEAIDYLIQINDIVLSGLATGAIETLMQKTITKKH
jgi:hypothetical protein